MEWWIWLVIVLAIVLIIVIAIVGWWISTSNWFRRQQVVINNAASGIDVALTKRFDLLTKQRDIVAGYAKHESETLMNVIAARTGNYKKDDGNVDTAKLNEFNKQLDEAAKQLNVVVERYPDLKANQNFLALQATTADVEDHLQASRRAYNSTVNEFNQARVTWPKSIVANHLHLSPAEFFQAEESKRADVDMKF